MARIRTIKPEFPQSESMGRVSREARLCYILLFTLSDDHGKLRGNSRMLASLLYPYDADAGKLIDKWLGELERESCVVRYTIDGDSYLKITNWDKHQKVDRPSNSKIPDPREDSLHSRESSRGLVLGSEDQGSEDQGSEDQGSNGRAKVSLNDLSTDHIRDWLAAKRIDGKYINHDENFILEKFKNYCLSKGKTYADYVAGYRNAFEWDSCQPKASRGFDPIGAAPAKSKWVSEADRLAAKYLAEERANQQGQVGCNAQPSLLASEAVWENTI